MKGLKALVILVAVLAGCDSCRTPSVTQRPSTTAAASAPSAASSASDTVGTRPTRVREPATAGQFYPSDPAKLAATIHDLVAGAKRVSERPARIVLTPHAGLEFSGHIAAESFKQLDSHFNRAVIIAANHNGDADYSGVSVNLATSYRMPGFSTPVSAEVERLVKLPGFSEVPAAHTKHMLEIELPFLRELRGDGFSIVPLVVGRIDRDGARRIASELAKLANSQTVFVFSVDLSHYYTYDRAEELDHACLGALVEADSDAVARCVADGPQVLLIMNELAGRLALTPRLVDYANSGDVSNDRSRVVGYGSLVYEDRFELGTEEGRSLTRAARTALELRIRDGRTPGAPENLERRWPRLRARRSAFVTLKKAGQLRGCIGSLSPIEPLAANVVHNAVSAALSDPRFSPVSAKELAEISLSVSVLDVPRPLTPMKTNALLTLLGARHPGVILEFGGHRSTFLPQVWDEIGEPKAFLRALCRKQHSDSECWSTPAARYQTYAAQVFAEGG